jgi:hypothetical protein
MKGLTILLKYMINFILGNLKMNSSLLSTLSPPLGAENSTNANECKKLVDKLNEKILSFMVK